MTDISLIPILKSEGWKVMTRSKLKSMKKEELIETIETLENNYGATIERANNSYSYSKSEIERLEKENAELKQKLESDELALNEAIEIIAELKMKLLNISSMARSCRQHIEQLAEGRKENNENIKKIQEFRKIDQKQILEQMDTIADLEKDKCELLGLIQGKDQVIAELKYNLKCRDDELAESKAQTEKMKCCGNCSEPCLNPPTVRVSECLSNNYSLWELIK